MSKPTSKVIQISTCTSHLDVLCEDGSIWHYRPISGWECVLESLNMEDQPNLFLENLMNLKAADNL